MEALKSDEYTQLLERIILSLDLQGDEEILVQPGPRGDSLLGKSFLKQVNAALQRQGKTGALKILEEKRLVSGGFIVRRGRVEINCTFPDLLNSRREALEIELAALLFASGEKP